MTERIKYSGCPLCQSYNVVRLRTDNCELHPLYNAVIPNEITWMRCNNCDHVFTDGYFSPETEKVLFEKTHESQKVGFSFEQNRWISARIVDRVSMYKDSGIWLDVGFGNGSLLFTAQEFGFMPVGIDMREDNVKELNAIGIDARCCGIAAIEGEEKYDVISMADVLEHMPFPQDGINTAWRLLKKDGILFCSMPAYGSVAWHLVPDAHNPYWNEIEHFHNFSRDRLYKLLREKDFEPVHYGVSDRYRLCMEVIAKKIS